MAIIATGSYPVGIRRFSSRLLHVKTGHLMGHQPAGRRLQHEILRRQPRIVEGMPVRLAIVLEIQAGHGKDQDRRTDSPFTIPLHQTLEQSVPVGFLMTFVRHDKSPRLFIT